MKRIVTALKAFVIGSLMLIPGVSGGAVAIVFDEYDNLVDAVPGLFRRKTFIHSLVYLLVFALGGLLGVFLMSPVVSKIYEIYPIQMMYFIIGTIIATVPLIIRKSAMNRKNWYYILFVALGALIVYAVGRIPEGLIAPSESMDFKTFCFQFLSGILISVGFVLPGVSISFLLVILGIYPLVIGAISDLNILPLLPIALGMAFGVVATTSCLKWALEKKPEVSYTVILGFLLFSGFSLIPRDGYSAAVIITSAVSFILGLVSVFALSWHELRKKNQ